ncbi:MAG: ABC transporter permease [Acidobacteria bacterium]|nr:ABC transporter permease [Acidobacteriota bacterium]
MTKSYVKLRDDFLMALSALVHDVLRDIALALRQLARQRGFAVVALLTLALGIGAPTAIFSAVHAVLLRPLPYADADRIVRFRMESQSPRGSVGFDALPVSEALQWAADTVTLEEMALFNDSAKTLTTPEGPVRLIGLSATPNLFALLGTAPAAGRPFDAGTRDVRQIVLSHTTWQRYFGANTSIVGTSITLDGDSFLVTGVMPEAFAFPTPETAFWVPQLLEIGGGRGMVLPAIARLRPGIIVDAAVTEGMRHLTDGGDPRVQSTLLARTLQDQMVGKYGRVLWVLLAAVGLVSVIATVNIALLLLTRGAGRAREFSIRLALGAGRGRLVRQLFVEGTTLAILGGMAGLIVGKLALAALVHIAPPDLPRLEEAGLDPLVLSFTAALVVVASAAFGVLSAGRVITLDGIRTLARAATESSLVPVVVARRKLNALAAAELALTVVLLVGAGLLLRSFVSLVLVDQGFDPHNALAVQVTLPLARYPSPDARLAFHERLIERARGLQGVSHVGLTTSMPNRQPTGRFAYDPIGTSMFADPFTLQVAEVRMVSAGFLEAAGLQLLSGRTFTDKDTEGSELVMVLSQRLARLHFPGRDPIGAMLYSESGSRRVIGVVRDVMPAGQASQGVTSDPAAYIPLRQSKDVLSWMATVTLVFRGTGAAAQPGQVRAMVSSLDPEMPIFNVRTLDEEVAGLVAGPRFSATALGLFALVALVMAAVGVYGVMAYSASRRTREIGVHMALGATPAQVLRVIMRDGVLVVFTGLAAGLLAAMWLAQSLTGLLHEVTPADPVALVTVALLLSAIGLVAVLIPAWRATRVSALAALRHD